VLFPFPPAGAGVLGGGGVAGLLVLSLARPEVDALPAAASLPAPDATGGLVGGVGGGLGLV
jgi:hypothetical protein